MVRTAVTAHTRELKVKTQVHCMLAAQLCKNIEGDPAKPGFAATTCWPTHVLARSDLQFMLLLIRFLFALGVKEKSNDEGAD